LEFLWRAVGYDVAFIGLRGPGHAVPFERQGDPLGCGRRLVRLCCAAERRKQISMQATYLDVTEEAGRAFFTRRITGPVVMLNLLRFRAQADYSATPHLAPPEPIDGATAYQRYIEHTLPLLRKSGGNVILFGRGGPFLIGPPDERWDAALLVRQRSVADFIAFASDKEYLAGVGHRTAALEDSRLLPLVEAEIPPAND
jgi:hypothetical protein